MGAERGMPPEWQQLCNWVQRCQGEAVGPSDTDLRSDSLRPHRSGAPAILSRPLHLPCGCIASPIAPNYAYGVSAISCTLLALALTDSVGDASGVA